MRLTDQLEEIDSSLKETLERDNQFQAYHLKLVQALNLPLHTTPEQLVQEVKELFEICNRIVETYNKI